MTFPTPSNSPRVPKQQPLRIRRRTAPLMFVALLLLAGFAARDASAQTGQTIQIYNENFDGVTAPALPSGWTTDTTGSGVAFATAANSAYTAPNAARVTMPAGGGSSTLKSPHIFINQPGAVLSFRHKFNTETGWDGGKIEFILEPQAQFPSAGYGQFLANGYNSRFRGTDNPQGNNPWPDGLAWSGNSNGYIETRIALPVFSYNYTIQIIWTANHDSTVAENGEWLIDSVSITGGFTATNSNSISIPSSGTASPYPSEITVSGQYGAVQQVVVRLHNFSHTSPDDVDLMLVGPTGRKIILMSDVGGTNSVSNVTLTFDDAAANYLPDEGQVTTGTYKPTDYGLDRDNFPSPAPSDHTFGSTLSTFVGDYPNGTYKLFLVDDNGNNAGSISGGWSIALRTSPGMCWMIFNVVPPAYSAAGGNGTVYITTQPGCPWSLTSYTTNVVTPTSATSGTGSGSVNFTVLPNTTGGYRTGWFNFQTPTHQSSTHVQQNYL